MNQILRSCKFDIYTLSRCYGNQSKQRTHYETLRIPENSSQKEIRMAFIKLSKELHPDIKGKESHSEYVKVNEAYNILSKSHLRRTYDSNIKYGKDSDPYSSYSSEPENPSRHQRSRYYYYNQSSNYTQDQWEDYINSQSDSYYYGINGLKRVKTALIALLCISFVTLVVILQIINMNRAISYNRDIIRARTSQYQREYRKAQLEAAEKSKEEQIQAFKAKVQASKENTGPLDYIN